MLTPTEAAWLAGFIDADGCIRLKKGMKNAKKNQNSLIPHVSISNTCVMTLNRIIGLLEKVTCNTKTSEKRPISPLHSRMANVDIMGMKQCKPLLLELLPYLVTQNLEAQILLQFIERRQTRGVKNKPYEPMDYEAHSALAYLKKSRHLRDYMPTIKEVFGQDIVRTNAKALEVAEMSTRLSREQLNALSSKLVWYRKDRSQGKNSIPK